jgi:hypothetical protein
MTKELKGDLMLYDVPADSGHARVAEAIAKQIADLELADDGTDIQQMVAIAVVSDDRRCLVCWRAVVNDRRAE